MNHLKTVEQIAQEYNSATEFNRIDIQRIVNKFNQLSAALKERTKTRLKLIKEYSDNEE